MNASKALERIAGLYRIEAEVRGRSADDRQPVRGNEIWPMVEALEPWLREKLSLISQKAKLAGAVRYTLSHWRRLTCLLDDLPLTFHPTAVRASAVVI